MDNFEMLINEIESELLKAKKAPFSGTDIVVNKMTMLNLISRIRSSYPNVLKEANQIKKERDDIINKATEYANNTMDVAEDRAKALISDSEIVKQANIEAEAMLKEAEDSYRKMDYEARALAFNILDNAEKAIGDGLNVINDKKRKLVQE